MGGKVCNLKARAVMIDMEERVINSVMQGPLRDLFEHTQTVTDVSGSGNNWAVGMHMGNISTMIGEPKGLIFVPPISDSEYIINDFTFCKWNHVNESSKLFCPGWCGAFAFLSNIWW